MRKIFGSVFAVVLVLGGCGGGGGGGGDGGSDIPYTGVTSQAKVTAANAADLAGTALGAVDLEDLGGIASRSGDAAREAPAPSTFSAAKILGNLFRQALSADRSAPRAAKPVRESWIEDGCGGPGSGSLRFDLTMDDETGELRGSVAFQEYRDCDGGVFRGTVTISGKFDLLAEEPEYLTMTFRSLSYQEAGDRIAMGGSMEFDFRGYPTTTTALTLNARDDVTGMSLRFENYRMSATDTGSGASLSLSGRCFHSDHGWVEVGTLEPLEVHHWEDYPFAGALQAEGSDGTLLLLTALSSTQCRIQADTDGIPGWEWDSGGISWEDL